MAVAFKQGLPKLKIFNLLSWTHEFFKVSKYKKKIKLDKIWAYQDRGSPQTMPPKPKPFNH